MDHRLQQLSVWVGSALAETIERIEPASSDASFRRYFRVTANAQQYIAMDAPPDRENCRPFVDIARAFGQVGVNVPQVLFQDLDNGFLLLTDFGSEHYLSALNESTANRLYRDAMNSLLLLQRGADARVLKLPAYDHALLLREMELFREWFLVRYLNISLKGAAAELLDSLFEFLAQDALAQPTSWVHRDYHSRNLMVTSERNPGVLDFQDAVVGPVTYDLVSLLKDCYIAWPRSSVEGWVAEFISTRFESRDNVAFEQFLRWFDLMGVQRQLKAIGIFARLNLRDGKPGYLKDIPRTLSYVLDVLPRYELFPQMSTFLREEVLPRLDQNRLG